MQHLSLSSVYLKHFQITDHKYLSHGGQKTVFKVTINDCDYALKLIHFVDERFKREVQISRQFQNVGGLPSIRRIEELDGRTIILEDYIEGNDLSEKMEDFIGREDKVCKLINRTADILTPIWKARYVHRDLKPQNIRLNSEGEPFILDFGIARALEEESITITGNQPLSWLYSSPEQYSGSKKLISYRTDFFCLGIIAFKLYTGQLPFGNSREEIQETYNSGNVNLDTNSLVITNFCKKTLSFSPALRPRNIEQFKSLLL